MSETNFGGVRVGVSQRVLGDGAMTIGDGDRRSGKALIRS
jgi:hypothetical protein